MEVTFLSEIKFKIVRLRKRIFVWAGIIIVMTILTIAMCLSPLSANYFSFPAFLLLALYVALLLTDILKYRKYKKARKEFDIHFKGADDRVSAFLQGNVRVKLVQDRNISVVDQYGNHLIIFQMTDEWLVETYFIDEEYPTYRSFSFDVFPKKTNWLANGKEKKPRWHEIVEKMLEENTNVKGIE